MRETVRMSEMALQDRPVELLQQLLRFDTTNPPGNERECVDWIAGLLTELGCEVKIVAARSGSTEPDRAHTRRGPLRPAACCRATSTWWRRTASGATTPSPVSWPTATSGAAERLT